MAGFGNNSRHGSVLRTVHHGPMLDHFGQQVPEDEGGRPIQDLMINV